MYPLEVADYSFDTDTIITAILHNTLEDKSYKRNAEAYLVKKLQNKFQTLLELW
ncbi:spoT-like ppGpp hydrolase domain protein [Orientia chuto str. Dubai]|uniref:SpoT-like ppGpp hydrolase domain protein n=1 Tax=Orientia chuto str. Dubai TaxID=1359168 RepID=A0A0F3MFS6_9RICK|nr:hypothetical protein [Candidatus Orientia mediorientalis]KJV54575.1 spoT-like ppGpp hydrolase domain protein [Orientia chuto str. Dubai]